jgi:hypothetical protein
VTVLLLKLGDLGLQIGYVGLQGMVHPFHPDHGEHDRHDEDQHRDATA